MSNTQLINDTLQSLNQFLPKVADTCLVIANDLRSDHESKATNMIQQFIEALDWSIQAINGIKSLNYPLNIETTKINEFLKETLEGLEVNDLVLIADMFEYELHPEIESWIKEIHQHKGE